MKRKIWFSFLLIALSAAMIGGATMAWFTAEADAPAATFKTGTVKVRADKGEEFIATPAEKYFDNVNPGDCATVTWNIVNTGTKAIELRVLLEKAWLGNVDLPEDNVHYAPRPDSGWVMYKADKLDENGDPVIGYDGKKEKEIWLYYVNGPVPGTYGGTSEAERTVSLPVVVAFDGAATGNEYQNKRFSLTGTVYAIQASNGAPAAEWDPAWTTVNDPDYSDRELKEYFLEGPGNDMDCWPGFNHFNYSLLEPEKDVDSVWWKNYYMYTTYGRVSGTIEAVDAKGNLVKTFNKTVRFNVTITLESYHDGWMTIPGVKKDNIFVEVEFNGGKGVFDTDWKELYIGMPYEHEGEIDYSIDSYEIVEG